MILSQDHLKAERPVMKALVGLLLGLALLLGGGGCASTGEDASVIPWNVPQAWEGSPAASFNQQQ